MDLFGIRREGVEAAGDAVVETRADADHQVAIVHRVVGLVGAVHAQHAEPVLAGRRIGAEAHQGRGDREAGLRHQFAQQGRGQRAGVDDAAAGIEDRLLGLGHHVQGLLDLADVALELRLIGLVLDVLGRRIDAGGELHVLRNVDHHRAGTARTRDIEGLVQDARQVLDAADEIIMLGAMAGDADRVRLLEGVRADQMRRHLAGDAHQRDRIHQGVGEAGDGVGRAGAGRHQQAADLAGRARIAFRRMGRALLVAHQDVLDPGSDGTRRHRSEGPRRRDSRTNASRPDPAGPAPPSRRRSSSSTCSAPAFVVFSARDKSQAEDPSHQLGVSVSAPSRRPCGPAPSRRACLVALRLRPK